MLVKDNRCAGAKSRGDTPAKYTKNTKKRKRKTRMLVQMELWAWQSKIGPGSSSVIFVIFVYFAGKILLWRKSHVCKSPR
jgi:hypothetical protein